MAAKQKIEKRGDEILIVHCTIPTRFRLIWFSGFRGEDLNVIFYQNMPNLHNRYISAKRKISQKNQEYMLNYPALHSRWPLLLKIEISSNGRNCSILSQNVPKFELYKHNDELFSMFDRIFYELLKFELILTYTKAAMDN
jgi:hypothetical protein